MNLWERHKNFIKSNIQPDDLNISHGITYWRNRLFINILVFLLPVGLLGVVPAVIIAYLVHRPMLALCDGLTFLICCYVAYDNTLSLRVRKVMMVGSFYLVTLALLFFLGTNGPSLIYLFAITVFTTLIFSIRVAYASIVANTFVCLLMVARPEPYFQSHSWFAVSSNLCLLTILTVTSIHILFRGLHGNIDKERVLHKNLKISEDLYRQLFNKNMLSLCIYDCKTYRFLLVNEEMMRVYGFSKEEFATMTIFDVLEPDSAAHFRNLVRNASLNGYRRSMEWRHVRKDGAVLEVDVVSDNVRYGENVARIVMITDVTQQRRSARLLEEQTRLTDTIVRNFPNGTVAIIDECYNIRYIGGQQLTRDNKQPEAYINTNYLQQFPEGQRLSVINFLEPVFQGSNSIAELEFGNEVTLNSAVCIDSDTSCKTVVIASQNITEQRLKEKSLTLFETAIIKSYNGFAIYTAPGAPGAQPTFTYINAAFEKMTGYTANELIGRSPLMLYAGQCSEAIAKVQDAMQQRQECKTEVLARNKNGDTFWMLQYLLPVKDENGVFVNHVSLHYDITANKQLEQEREQLVASLSLSEGNLRALIDNTTDYIWSVDRDLNFIALNEAFAELGNRWSFDFSIGRSAIGVWIEMSQYSAEQWQRHYQKALSGKKHAIHHEIFMPDSGRHIVSISFNPIYNAGGNITGVGCFMKDVTQQKLYEERLKHKNEQLRAIAFLTSHTLRAPLTNMLALVNMLDLEDFCNSENKEIISYVHKSALQLDSVIRDIVGQTDLHSL